MEKKKLITALMVGCMAFLPAKSADVNVTEGISGAISQAITNEISDTMYIQNGLTFSNNKGATSGCIFNKGSLVIRDGIESNHTTFQGNTISSPWGGGGAINSYDSGGTSVYVGDYTSFVENSSANPSGGDSGGAIYVGDATLTIGDHVNFYKNSTPANGTTFGGAVFIQNSETKIGNYINVEENSAKSGGGLSINNSNIADPAKSLVTIGTNANFENNKAENGDGGAISIENTSLKIGNTASFSGNSATNNGGAINSTGSADTTTITIGSGSSFTGNSATNSGGAIYNTATVNVNGATFSGNKAAKGGALYNAQNATASLQDVTFSAASGDASNSIYNAGSVTTASTDNNTNLFASTTTIDGDWTYGGNNNVTGNIDGSGKIINEGSTTFAGNNSQFTGSFTQSVAGAETTVTGTFFGGTSTVSDGTLNWETQTGIPSGGSLTITGGILNIGSADGQTTGKFTVGNGSSIAGDVTTKIENTSTLNINNGGSVVLNSEDDWSGTIVLGTAGSTETDSKLDISGLSQNGTLQANSGTLDVGTGDLNISTGSYIENAVRIETEGNINITGEGRVGIDNNDQLDANSVITLKDQGTLNYGNTTDPNFKIKADSGNLNLLGGSKLTINGSSSISDAVALDIQQNSQLTLAAATLNLDNADKWDGKIINEQGTINANGLINDSQTASLEQTGGVLNVYNDAQVTLGKNSFIQNGKINIYTGDDGENGSTFTLTNGSVTGGDMTIDENSAFIVKNGTFSLNSINGKGVVDQDGIMHASLVDVANGQRVQHSITEELAIDTQTNFNMDIHARGNHYTSNDQFVVSRMTGNGTARIDNWSLNGDIFGWDAPIDRHITLDHIFVDENGNPLQGNIEITRKTEFTPIGYYQLNQKGSGTGLHYTLDLVDFNPQVFRGQVATVAQWMNQLAIDDMLFTHSMVLPSFKDEDGGIAYSGMMANRYASSNPLFAPYQYSRKDGGLWYKMYGTFENLNMNVSGLGRVGNNAYGALIGADFGLKELKNGWKFMPTAYVGYNGAHQAYPGIGAYQNGGQAGFLGTWYKNNFILGGLVYGGVYENSMDVAGHVDNAFNYFAGAATKLAYNWRFHRDWVLQPNLMAAYNFFGQQNWHSDYGQMGMMAGMLNGVNIAPGVNLIWEKETFSIYGTLQYMYNVNGAVGGRAGNVGLPQVEMERGYIQYGLGFNKRWGERFSGYLQAVLRNVGRTGVGFQLGFNFLLGK